MTQLIPDITIISRQDTDLEDEFIIYSLISLAKIETCEKWILILMLQKKWNFLHMYIYIIKIWWNSWYIWHYLQSIILAHPSNQKAGLTEESAYVSVPVALYIFMALMHENSDILDADGNIDDNQQD